MDYEKKYKEALERAREYWETDNDNTLDIKAKGTMEYLFPELAESEDEKIRKELLTWLQNTEGQVLPMDRYNAALAWLEKQGETYTKKDVDNAYLEGMAFAKDELEKQGKQKSQRMISAEAKEAMYAKTAWSEEDEKEYKYVLKFVDNILNNCGNKKDYEHCKRCYDWLKSLRPQNRWKPSDEQLEALKNAIHIKPFENPSDNPLWGLYEQLKKLRKE